MCRNENCTRADVQRDFEQIAAVQSENRSPIRMEVPDCFQTFRQDFSLLQTGQQNQVMHLAHPAVLLVNGTDFPGNDKTGRIRQATILMQRIKPILSRGKGCFQLLPPCRMGKISCADD